MVLVVGCGEPALVELTPMERDEFCAQFPAIDTYFNCAPPGAQRCDLWNRSMTCRMFIDALPASCTLTSAELAPCLREQSCSTVSNCATFCGVTLWRYSGGSCG